MTRRILAVDIGSTTTKTILFEKTSGGWVLLGKTMAPTTVEAPHNDVMIGLKSAIGKLEKRTGVTVLHGSRLIKPSGAGEGVDLVLVTSSAGGGLQMVVTGLMKEITAESAHRAALGAGAVVSDVISLDDTRSVVERVDRLKRLRPDMILVTGGTDGGNISEVAAMAEMVAMANPEPRFGKDFKIPVVFAGNVDARSYVADVFKDVMDVTYTDNVRPVLEEEVLDPARREIHRLFLEHVMMHAPGYKTVLSWAEGNVKPTPMAVGNILSYFSRMRNQDVLGVDVGGATTDVFSVIDGKLYRTVSANLGMSYSMGNVLAEASPEAVLRWLPFDADENLVRNWNFNKMIRPTTLPQTIEELVLEQAVSREALRLSLGHHRSLIRGLKGIKKKRSVGDVFNQEGTGETLVDLLKIGAIVGSGGVLSYAPRRSQAAMILLDGFQPEGVTDLFVDSQFLLPHLGVLVDVDPEAAEEILLREALVPLGTAVCPVGPAVPPGTVIARVRLGGETYDVVSGDLRVVPVDPGRERYCEVVPSREFDAGAGKSNPLSWQVLPGPTGLILDGRGRPLKLPDNDRDRRALVRRWYRTFSAYPADFLEEEQAEAVRNST